MSDYVTFINEDGDADKCLFAEWLQNWTKELVDATPLSLLISSVNVNENMESDDVEDDATERRLYVQNHPLCILGHWFYDLSEYKGWGLRVDSHSKLENFCVSYYECSCFFTPPCYGDRWDFKGTMVVPGGAFYTRLMPYDWEEFKHLKPGDDMTSIMFNGEPTI